MSAHLFKRHQRRKWRHRPKTKTRAVKHVGAEEMLAMQNEGKLDKER